MEVTATLLFATAVASAVIGAAVAVLGTSVSLRRSLAREAERIETKLAREEGETRAAVDRLTHVVAAGSQGWYWTDEWQEGEREADKDLAEGRSQRFTSLEEMDEALERASLRYAANR